MTEGFDDIVYKHFNYKTEDMIDKVMDQSPASKQEFIIFNEVNHYHQTDLICIAPLESIIRSHTRAHLNLSDIYLLNTNAVMIFLHKNGFNRSFDVERLKYRVKKYEKKFLRYKKRYHGHFVSNSLI